MATTTPVLGPVHKATTAVSTTQRMRALGVACVSFGGTLLMSIGSQAHAGVVSKNISGTIANAGTFQALLPQGTITTWSACNLQNPADGGETLYVDVGEATSSASQAHSFQLSPGGFYDCADASGVEAGTISIMAATAGHAFAATVVAP